MTTEKGQNWESRCSSELAELGWGSGKRVIVIITDVKDRSSEKSVKEKWGKWKFPDVDLITLTCQEIDFISTYISQDLSPERRMAGKIHILKNILQTTAVEQYKIGIFSRSDRSEYSWLVKLLTSMNFCGRFLSATPYYIANYQFEKFKCDVSQCTFGILYHTQNSGRINVTNVTSSLYDEELEHLHEKLGRDNVIVVIDDLEESTDQVKDQILKEQHSIKEWARDLFIFCQEEKKTDPHIIPHIISYMEEKMKRLEAMITGSTGQCAASSTSQGTPAFPDSSRQNVPASASSTGQLPPAFNIYTALFSSLCKRFPTSQSQSRESEFNSSNEQNTEKNRIQRYISNIKPVPTIGIFSITEDTEYNWLKSLLGNKFRNVRSFYISFSRFHQFQNDLSQCSYGILYHTKNRGRINVTDVTDSLYDKHLKHMSDTLGKNRVIVVLDDLDDNSDEMKRTILQQQPKIRQLARDLFLVKKGTDRQKICYFEHNRKPDFS
ncbi:uncharacterized protein LOC143925622 [Lithobates pipiens]